METLASPRDDSLRSATQIDLSKYDLYGILGNAVSRCKVDVGRGMGTESGFPMLGNAVKKKCTQILLWRAVYGG